MTVNKFRDVTHCSCLHFYFSLPLLFLLVHPKQLSHWQNITMLMISLPILYYVFTHTTLKLYGLFLLAFFAVWLQDFFKDVLAKFPTAFAIALCLLTLFILFAFYTFQYTLLYTLCQHFYHIFRKKVVFFYYIVFTSR